MADKRYGGIEMEKAVGMTQMQRIHWSQHAVKAVRESRGRGRNRGRKYSEQNKFEFGICFKLNRHSIPPYNMKQILDWLRGPCCHIHRGKDPDGKEIMRVIIGDVVEQGPESKRINAEMRKRVEIKSFWDFIKAFPETNKRYLVVDRRGDLGENVFFGVFSTNEIHGLLDLEFFDNAIIIDLGKLIKNLGGL